MQDIIIIGAGCVGAFVARVLSRYDAKVLLLEKDNDVGDGASMANTAIAHSGYDPIPGTKKARFNVLGNKMIGQVCEELDVPFKRCGTLTVATEDSQIPTLYALIERAKENDSQAEFVDKKRLLEMEPNINPDVKGALYAPTGGIVDPFALVAHAVENALDNGVTLHLAEAVTDVKRTGDHFAVKTTKGEYESKVVINCAGVYSDEIASLIEPVDWQVNPRKGEYFVLTDADPHLVNHPLFPLPSEKGKGILVTNTVVRSYLVGPSSEFTDEKDDVSTDSLTLARVKEEAEKLVPHIPFKDQVRVYSGVRPTPTTKDFVIEPSHKYKEFINVAGIESPGLVSSPAIAEYVVKELVLSVLPLKEKKDYNPRVRRYIRPLEMSLEERDALIKKNPDYGKIVCLCRTVSLGEIEDLFSRSLPCNTIKAVNKRLRTGFGRCQGGFCQPYILDYLAQRHKERPEGVEYGKPGSFVVESEKEDGSDDK